MSSPVRLRPRTPDVDLLRLSRSDRLMILTGVDFGGTKIEVAVLDAQGAFLARLRAPNPGAYDAAIVTVCDLIQRAEQEAGGGGGIGVGAPGSISPRTGTMRNANSIWLNGRPFREDLETALGRPVRFANDADCLALSESVDGAAAGLRSAFAVIIGTGCGGGLVVDGRLVEGANGLTGEWGHISLPWPKAEEVPGPPCWCGRHGCLETWISGTGLRDDYARHTGRTISGEAVVASARVGEPDAVYAFDRYIDRLGRGLAMVVNLLDPQAFVFGGGLSNVHELYDRLPQAIAPYVFSDAWTARLAPARWGDSSGVRGAAYLWAQGAQAVGGA